MLLSVRALESLSVYLNPQAYSICKFFLKTFSRIRRINGVVIKKQLKTVLDKGCLEEERGIWCV